MELFDLYFRHCFLQQEAGEHTFKTAARKLRQSGPCPFFRFGKGTNVETNVELGVVLSRWEPKCDTG